MKIFCKRNITIYTILVLLAVMALFEFGFCNVQAVHQVLHNEEIIYNFSLCRIVFYFIFIVLYCVFKNKFLEVAEETYNSKPKRIITYITIIIAAIFSGWVFYSTYKLGTDFIRIGTVRIIIALLSTLFVIYISKDISKNIIVAACTFGIVFTFTTDYNHAIDEKKHFMSALNVSFLNFDYINNPITDTEIAKIPHLTRYVSIDEWLENNYTPSISSDVNMEDTPSTPANYKPIIYALPAVGIAIARVLNGSIVDMYILGRIMNLVLYTVLVYIAMKILPFKKNIFFVVAFIPYMLLLAASYSADGICLGTIYIFVAYCLKIYKESETISLKQFLILATLLPSFHQSNIVPTITNKIPTIIPLKGLFLLLTTIKHFLTYYIEFIILFYSNNNLSNYSICCQIY